jgi:uncharacterized membrane protein HdeD (DUF308 family)
MAMYFVTSLVLVVFGFIAFAAGIYVASARRDKSWVNQTISLFVLILGAVLGIVSGLHLYATYFFH